MAGWVLSASAPSHCEMIIALGIGLFLTLLLYFLGEVSRQCEQRGFLVSPGGEDDLVGQTSVKLF